MHFRKGDEDLGPYKRHADHTFSSDILRGPSWPSPSGRGARMPAVLRACAPVRGVDIVGATHGSPAFCPRFVLATKDVVDATSAGARNSGRLRSRFCYFDTLLPLASCRKLDPLRTPRADISVGPFSLGKAVLCLGQRPTSSNPRPSGARCARVHLRSCCDVANLGQNIRPDILAGARMYAPAPEGRGPGWPS